MRYLTVPLLGVLLVHFAKRLNVVRNLMISSYGSLIQLPPKGSNEPRGEPRRGGSESIILSFNVRNIYLNLILNLYYPNIF